MSATSKTWLALVLDKFGRETRRYYTKAPTRALALVGIRTSYPHTWGWDVRLSVVHSGKRR